MRAGGERILAAVVDLLDRTPIRIGNRQYARENGSFGLTTLAKDFRTWTGTVLAATSLAGFASPRSKAHAKRILARASVEVSRELGNTPAVCRKHYVHPGVVDAFLASRLGEDFAARTNGHSSRLSQAERAVLRLLVNSA